MVFISVSATIVVCLTLMFFIIKLWEISDD